MSIRSAFKRLRTTAIAGVAAIGLSATPQPAHAFLDTEKAWNDLLQFAVRQINAPGEFEIELGKVTRPEDGFAQIESLKIKDGDGVWLDASNLLIDWNASSLLRGRFSFEKLAAEQVTLLRAPIGRGDPPGDEAQVDFAWPRPPVSMRIDALEIGKLRIEGGMLPQDIEARVTGSFVDEGDEQAATLNVQRLDRVGDEINLVSNIDFDGMDITFELDAKEAPGGLVGQMAGVPSSEALLLDLTATGDASNLPFALDAEIGAIGIAKGEGIAAWSDRVTAKFDGTITPGPKSATVWKRALGEVARIKLDATETSPGTYQLSALNILSNAFVLDGKGTVDTAANTIDMALDFAAKDIDALNDVIAPSKLARLEGKARATGTLTSPKLDINAAMDDFSGAFGSVEELLLEVRSAPAAEGEDQSIQRFGLTARADGLALEDTALQDALGPTPTLTGNGAFYGRENRVALDELSIRAKTVDLTGDAQYNITSGAIDAALSGSAKALGPFLKAAGVPVEGAATLAMKIQGLTSQTVERLFLNAQLTDLDSSDPTIAAALGETATLEVLLAQTAPGRVAVERGFIESNVLRANASGSLSIPEDDIDIELDWALIDTAKINPLIEPASVEGALGTATVTGTISEPQIAVDAKADGLAYEDYTVAKAAIVASGQYRKDLRAPFALDAALEGVETGDSALDDVLGATPRVVAKGIYDTATGLLTLEQADIDLARADAAVSGDIGLTKKTLNIDYDFEAADLSGFAALVGTELAGSVDIAGRLEGPFALPFVTAKGKARDLRYAQYSVDALDLDVETEAPKDGAAPFRIDLTASNPGTGDPALDALLGETPNIAAKGTLNPDGPRVTLEFLDARLAALLANASGRVDLAAKTLNLDFDLEAEDLSGLGALLDTEISGAVDAKGRASGSFSAPEIVATINGSKLRYDIYGADSLRADLDIRQSARGFAPFDVDIEAKGARTGDAKLDALLKGASTLKAKGEFNQKDQRVRIASAKARVAGTDATIAGSVDLAGKKLDVTFDVTSGDLAPFSGLAGTDLAGAVKAKGSASGSFTAPAVTANLDGQRFRYGDYRIGALEGDIAIEQAASGYAPFDIDVTARDVSTGDAALDELLGATAKIAARGGFNQSAQKLRIDSARLTTDAATASLNGLVDLAKETLDLTFDLDAAALEAFAPLVGTDLAGSLKAKGTAAGSFTLPEIDAEIAARSLRYDSYKMGALDGTVKAGPAAGLNGKLPFNMALDAAGLATGDPGIDAALGTTASIRASGVYDGEGKRLDLRTASVRSGFGTADASGSVDLGAETLDLGFSLDARDLGPLSLIAGTDLSGALTAKGTASGSFSAPSVNATLSGQSLRYDRYTIATLTADIDASQAATGFAPFRIDASANGIGTGDPSLDAVLAGGAKLTANGEFNATEQRLRLTEANADLGFATASANGSVDIANQTLDLAYALDVVRLDPLSGVVGQTLGGSLSSRGNVSGSFTAPVINAALNGTGLQYGQYTIASLRGDISGSQSATGFAPFRIDASANGIGTGDPSLDAVLAGGAKLKANGEFNATEQRLRLTDANVDLGFATAQAAGSIDLANSLLDLDFALNASQLDALSGLVGTPLAGALNSSGRVSGSFTDPSIDATLDGRALRYDKYRVGSVTGRVSVPSGAGGPAPFDVDVVANAISTGDPALDALLGTVTVDANGTIDRNGPRIQLDSARVDAGFARVNATGNIDIGAEFVDVTFDFAADDLSPASGIAGKSVGGSLRGAGSARGPFVIPAINLNANGGGLYYDIYSLAGLDLDLSMPSDPSGLLPFSLNARASQPRLGNPQIEALLGDIVTVDARGIFDPNAQRLTLDGANALAAIGSASASGSVDLAGEILALNYSANLPDLYPLQGLAGKPLAGMMALNGTLNGPFADPATRGTASGQSLVYDSYQVARLNASYDLQRLISGPAGNAAIDAETAFGPLTASADFDLTGGQPRIPRFALNGLGVRADGAFNVLPGGVYSGTAMLDAFELSSLGGFLGLDIAGRTSGTVTLAAPDGRQTVYANLTGENLRYADQGSMGTVSVQARVDDAFAQNPSIDAVISGANGSAAGFPIQRIDATARGQLSALDITVTGDAGETGSERIDAAAFLNLANSPRSAYISRLGASYKGIPFALVKPLTVEEVLPGGWRMSALDARVQDGELRGSGSYGPGGLVTDIAMRNLPLTLAGLAGVDIIRSGRLQGNLKVDTRGAVQGNFDLTAYSLRLNGAQVDEPFDFSASGTMDGQALNVTGTISGSTLLTPLTATARIPLISVAGSPLPAPNMNAPFSANVDWQGDVSEVWAFVPAPDHVLSGPVNITGRAAGTLDNPSMSGGATLTGGRYSNLEFGTLLTEMNARADFTQDGRVVFDLTSLDGVQGQVTASGSYVVGDGTLDTQLNLTNAALVRRDDLTAVISGNASAKSVGRDIAVVGDFRTDYVELRLIGGFGSSIVDIDIIPIGETAPIYTPPEPDNGKGQRISLDVSLDFPQQVYVRGRGLDSEWGGRLDVSGFASDPKIVGAIERRRGWLDLLGRQFQLSIGEVRFTGPLDPFIRVRLQRESNDITGWVEVEGFSSDLDIGFGSIPDLPTEEVLPRLLFGRSKQSLTALEAAQLAAGVNTLLSGKAGVLDTVRGAVGVDVLRVETDDDGGTAIVTGKYLTENVFVGAKQNIESSATSGLVEIEVFDNYEIEAELGSTEATGSINWKLDY